MKDSARPSQDDSTTPAERPAWRFSGRRGTPVHLRDQAPQTLPPEIRSAITQLARERAGESAPAADARPVRPATTASGLQLNRDEAKAAPPVAAAPLPVERRTRRDSAEPAVATSPIPTAEAPVAPIELPTSADTQPAPVAETPVVETPDVEAPAPAAQVADVPAAETPSTTTAATDVETASPAVSAPDKRKLTPAERKKRAKARAKARARSQRGGKKGFGETTTDGGRRLFARGRDLEADEAAAIEPTIVAEGPVSTSVPAPAPVPAPEPDVAPTPEMPAPILGTENGAQAAWELGRLPILLSSPTADEGRRPDAEPAATPPVDDSPSVPTWETVAEAPRVDARPTSDATVIRDVAADDDAVVRPTRSRDRDTAPRTMRPMDWRAIGSEPAPAPIEPAELPRRATPDAIARLDAPLAAQDHGFPPARAGARDDSAPATSRTSEARRRIARRRAELDDVVHMLAGLGSGRRDA